MNPPPPRPDDDIVLEVSDLRTHFTNEQGRALPALDGVSFSLRRGRTLALVGESGCGKSVTSFSLLRLVQPPGRVVGGRVVLRSAREGEIDLTALPENSPRLRQVRGGLVSMIFQEPMTALSPVHSVGSQIAEILLLHGHVSWREARRRTIGMLGQVGISAPERRFDQYPHEMSGGMRQRIMIAMALICRPELLIADEPTTALDVTIQAQILGVIRRLQHDLGCSVLLITHDLGVVAQVADDVAVMYLGRIVERGAMRDVVKRPRHPYTQGLLASLPSRQASQRLTSIPGAVPPLWAIPPGCPFHPRCAHAVPGRCDVGGPPVLRAFGGAQHVACVRAEEIAAEQKREDAHV